MGIHGNRAKQYVAASELWDRLGIDVPTEHPDADDGFSAEVIAFAQWGREHVGMGIEESTTIAYNTRRPRPRTHIRHGV